MIQAQPVRRTTKQREIVLKAVTTSRTHPSADEVYRIARRSIPSISLATVYRNLGLLVADGLIREVQFHGDVSRYDGMLAIHEHFYCKACGSVTDLPPSLSRSAFAKVEAAVQGVLEHYALDYYGLCATCNTKQAR